MKFDCRVGFLHFLNHFKVNHLHYAYKYDYLTDYKKRKNFLQLTSNFIPPMGFTIRILRHHVCL